jgi:ABC-type polysaccharide/polyol phosphate export systems, permease component
MKWAFNKGKELLRFVYDIWLNRGVIWALAKNDFKVGYAGSLFGAVWAFIQPVMTILVFWFVFQVGFRSAPVAEVPFLLWFSSGLIPWFFFSTALSNGTNCLMEYSYLVKKIVFRVAVLPIIKILSAFFVHLFFIAFLVFLYICYGQPIPWTAIIQLPYYALCMFFLVLGFSYITSAVVVFLKDIGQIISIVLQFGMWMTPIMWNYQEMVPQKWWWLIKLNPMCYIVDGYRDSLISGILFYQKINSSLYFWAMALFIFAVGAFTFRRLRPHFADVL